MSTSNLIDYKSKDFAELLENITKRVLIMKKNNSKLVRKILFAPVITGIGYLFTIMSRELSKLTLLDTDCKIQLFKDVLNL